MLSALITHCWVPLDRRSWPWPRPPAGEAAGAACTDGLLSRPLLGTAATGAGLTASGLPPVRALRESLPKAEFILVGALAISASRRPILCSACLTLFSNCSLVNGLLT